MDNARDVKQSDHDVLIRLEERLENLDKRMGDRFDSLEKKLSERDGLMDDRHSDHEKRLRAIERRLWALPSVATVIALIGIVISLWDYIKGA